MKRALMVGGPLHGLMRSFKHLNQVVLAPRRAAPPTFITEPLPPLSLAQIPEPHQYELRWYDGDESYPPIGRPTRLPAYHCADRPEPMHQPANAQEAFRQFIADELWRAAYEATLPTCVVPDCTDKARATFTAAERGRLAGRNWDYGDEIKVCPRHGSDIHRSQFARGMDQLPEWLRPDATWDWIDTFDGYDPLCGAELLARTARMLRLRQERR